MSLAKKSFKELNLMMEEVSSRFFAIKKMIYLSIKGEMLMEKDERLSLYLSKVEQAFQSLDERSKNLINNEFFYQNYHDWWIGLYSKTSFYRFKRKAMRSFLEALYEN